MDGEAGRLAAAIRGVKEQEVVHRCVQQRGPPYSCVGSYDKCVKASEAA